MATWDDVRRLALALPDTVESERTWRVRGKLIAWERPLRPKDVEALGDSAWKGDILAARTGDLGDKQALLADEPEIYFTTPHFDGYPAVLLRLERIDAAELAELLGEAWLAQAPKRLAQSYLDTLGRQEPDA